MLTLFPYTTLFRSARLLFFLASFESGGSLVKSSLHIDHAELPVFPFAMGRHRPEKANGMSGHRHVGMKSAGHQHGIAVADHGHQLRILSMVIHKLNAKCRVRHVEIYV